MIIKRATRQYFPDGSSYNPNLGTLVFGVILPVEGYVENIIEGAKPSPKSILHCLARSIENLKHNPMAQSALKGIFDCIYDRTTENERKTFPNWFDSQ